MDRPYFRSIFAKTYPKKVRRRDEKLKDSG